jgi:hypothetical protein
MRAGAAALLYAAVLAVCYAPVLFGGKTLQAPHYTTSGVLPESPEMRPGRRPVNTFDVDMATPAFYEWPLDRFIGRSLRQGVLPLWNPHQAAGTPLVVNYSTRAFFPYQLLLDLSPLGFWDFFFVLRLWIAGWLTWCFLARAGLPFAPAALGGLLYMLSGAFTWFVNLEQLTNAAMVVPLFFLAVETFVAGPGPRRAAFVAVAIGLNLLAGQPEVTAYALVAGGLYGIVRWVSAGRIRARRAAGWGAGAVLVGFALAAPLLVPFAAHLPNAFHLHASGGDMGVRDPANPALAVAIFVPTFFELPTVPRSKPDNGRWDFLGGYGGVLAAFLAIAGLLGPGWSIAPRRRAALIFFVSVWGWIVLKNFGVHPFDWIGYLPIFDQVWTPRWAGATWCFALSAAAAFSLARVQDAGEVTPAVRARLLLSVMAVLLGVELLAASAMTVLEPALAVFWAFVWPGAFGGQAVAAAILALAAAILLRLRAAEPGVALFSLAVVERWFPIPRGYAPDWLAFRLVPVAFGLLAVACLVARRRAIAAMCGIAAVVAALVLDHNAPFGLPERRDPAIAPPVVRFLKERGAYDRIMGDRRAIAPNYASVFGLYDVRYVEALAVDSFQRFVVEGLETTPRRWWHALWFTGDPERPPDRRVPPGEALEEDVRLRLRGYSLLSVRHIVVPPGMDLNRRARDERERFPIVYQGEAVVYENSAALPRAFVVGEWESASSAAEARTRVLTGTFDLRARAVVEGAPVRPGGGRGRAEIVEYAPNGLALDVEASAPALVVLTDTFYPGWRAWVDGRPAAIYRTNGVVRGVFVGAGRHRVTMRFFPPSQAAGLALAGLAAAAIGVMGLRRSPPGTGAT